MSIERKVHLTYPPHLVDQPLIRHINSRCDQRFPGFQPPGGLAHFGGQRIYLYFGDDHPGWRAGNGS